MIINSFSGQYRFLSNFYPSPITVAGKSYASVEHLFQASKTVDQTWHEKIRLASTPSEAKRLGRQAPLLLANWEEVKETVMYAALCLKFVPGSFLGQKLLDTGDVTLIEGNTWGDRYWGVSRGIGLNRLGILLMKRREELRDLS